MTLKELNKKTGMRRNYRALTNLIFLHVEIHTNYFTFIHT